MKSDFKIHSVKYNFIMNIILKMSAFIFPLITFPYTSRILLASGNGKIAFASSIINYFMLFASLGIPTYGVKVCAQIRDDKEKLSKTVHELLTINIICMFFSYIVFIIMMLYVPEFKENSILLWINSLSILLSVAGIEWFYQAIKQYDYITFRNILFKVISIILMFLFVHDSNDYIIYGAITIIGTVGSNILNLLRLPRYITFKLLGNYCFKQHLKPIILLFLYSAATTIYTNMDTVMLGFISGDIEVGYYNAAVRIKTILVSLVTALGSVLMPRISYYLQNNMKEQFNQVIKKSFEFIFLASLPLTLYFMFEAQSTIFFLAGTEYAPAIRTMQLIMPSIIFIGIGSVTAWQLLIPLDKNNFTVLGAILGGLINLGINAILIPKCGSTGAAIGTVIAEIMVVCVHALALKDILKQVSIVKDLLKITISVILSTTGYLVFIHLFSIHHAFLRLVATSIIFFSIYGLSLLLLKETLIFDIISSFYNKIKNKRNS